MKYSKQFTEDITWYFNIRHKYNFDGVGTYYNKRGTEVIQYSKTGIDGIRAFFEYDSNGNVLPTKHPNILKTLLKTKGSINLHIKMYAEDRAKGRLPELEFKKICTEINSPNWFINAVEKQKYKYY